LKASLPPLKIPLEMNMKNYFTIAALLGAIAFASVSFLAQAQQNQDSRSNVMVKERAATPVAEEDPSDGEEDVDEADAKGLAPNAQDEEDCRTASQSAATHAEKAAAFTRCMAEKRGDDVPDDQKDDAAE
jgi:hypothetical protein